MLTVSEEIETGELGGGLILKGSFQNTHSNSYSILGNFQQGGGHLTEWAVVPLLPRAPVPLSRSDLESRCGHSSRRSGKLSPAELGSGPAPSFCGLGSAAKFIETPRFLIPAPPSGALRSEEVTNLLGAHPRFQTQMAFTPRHLAPGQVQAGPGTEPAAGSGTDSVPSAPGGHPSWCPSPVPLTIAVNPSAEPHFNSSPGDRQFPEVVFFSPFKKRAWFLL